jgi:hypothetical protein
MKRLVQSERDRTTPPAESVDQIAEGVVIVGVGCTGGVGKRAHCY